MRMKHIFLYAGIVVLLAVFLVIGVKAYIVDTFKVHNHIKTGIVDISLAEYRNQNGLLLPCVDGLKYEPNNLVSCIPRITNKGMDCYVRAKIHMSGGNAESPLDENAIRGINTKDWIKHGDYYYYKSVLKENEATEIFTGIRIPKDWTQELENPNCSVEIIAQAIQAANFTPNFEDTIPWGKDIEIQAVQILKS